MIEKEVEIINKLGLHLRAAALLVKTASSFESAIYICKDDMKVDAKSIMGVLGLAAGKGTVIKIIADGADEEPAMQALVDLVDAKFDEEE